MVGHTDARSRDVAVLCAGIGVKVLILLPFCRDYGRLTALGKVRTVFGRARWKFWRDSRFIFAESVPIALLLPRAIAGSLRLAQPSLQVEVVARFFIASITATQLILACVSWLIALVRLLLSTRRACLLSGVTSVCLGPVQATLALFRLLVKV